MKKLAALGLLAIVASGCAAQQPQEPVQTAAVSAQPGATNRVRRTEAGAMQIIGTVLQVLLLPISR